MGNQYTQEYSHDYCINLLKKQLESRCPEWEYVRGYTWSDGKVILRNKNCGHEKEVSCITIRKVGNEDANRIQRKIVCKECAKEETRKRKEQKHKRIEYEMFMHDVKPVKVRQMGLNVCPVCGALYFANGIKSKYCSKECMKKQQSSYSNRHKDFRKRVAKTKESKEITLQALYKRDNGICWLCGKPCDITLDGNDNYYPSIDHVIPIAKGGKDLWSNVKLAHRICNTMKSDHIIDPLFDGKMGDAQRPMPLL